MASRVVTTIKKEGKIIGFRVIGTKPQFFNIFCSLAEAEKLYRAEAFENVELMNHRWKGLECSIDALPIQDERGNYIKKSAGIIVLRRVLSADGKETVGYEFMNLNGRITKHTPSQAIQLAKEYGLINATIVEEKYIRALRGNLKVKKLKGAEVNEKGRETKGVEKAVEVIKPREKEKEIEKKEVKPVKINFGDEEEQKELKKEEVLKREDKLEEEKKDINPLLIKQKELTDLLDRASTEYYFNDNEIMTNFEYDAKEKELKELEGKTGVVFSNSVTNKVGGSNHFYSVSKLAKVKHPSPMLSLDKTKDRDELGNLLGNEVGYLSWKLDGLTVVLTYEQGELVSIVTRGNGTTGEDITHNASAFTNIPKKISYTGRLVLRGEALISYAQFEKINASITVEADRYKNPRNLASGTVRQLDSKEATKRKPVVVIFEVKEGYDDINSKMGRMKEVEKLGFEIVPFVKVKKEEVKACIGEFEKKVKSYKYPTDGLVLGIDDIKYGELLGMTGKFPRHSKAFKWQDEEAETELTGIDWSCSRTGAITPVAMFKPVDLEGTTVTRASMHNISVMTELLGEHPYKGQKIKVIKSNMIIPQITWGDKS